MTTEEAKKAMYRIANSNSILEVRDLLRFGFEFEYQSYSEAGDGEIDHDAAREAFDAQFDAYSEAGVDLRRLAFDVARGFGSERTFIREYEAMEQNCYDAFVENNASDFTNDKGCVELLEEEINSAGLSDLLESGSDSSVDGGEIRTIDALTVQEFIKAAKFISSRRHSFAVDTGCSFHIHVSVVGIKHTYSYRIQAEMMLHLISEENFVKSGDIHSRLKSSSASYFRFITADDKYTAVHYHSQGTWEFRLFGNIKKHDQFIKGMLSTYRALRHAYRVRLKISDQLCTTDNKADIDNILARTLSNPEYAKVNAKKKKLNGEEVDLGA